jgi:hypothetical protein
MISNLVTVKRNKSEIEAYLKEEESLKSSRFSDREEIKKSEQRQHSISEISSS